MTKIRSDNARIIDKRAATAAAAKKRAVNEVFTNSNRGQTKPKNPGLYPKQAPPAKTTPGPRKRAATYARKGPR